MPYVNVRLAGEVTEEQKTALCKKITDVITEVTGKPAQYTYVVLEEVPRENWSIGGVRLSDR